LALLHARQLRRDLMVLTLALAGFILAGSILVGFERYGQLRAGTALIPAIKAELKPDTRIYSIGTYEQSLTWYLERSVILVAYRDEFGFGLDQQPELAIPQMQAFVGQWTRDAAAGVRDLGIVRADIYNHLKQQGVPMRVVAQDKRRIVIANI
ncbi:MAG: glycosyltransferase family 39 protein, partial [Telluria sp.]